LGPTAGYSDHGHETLDPKEREKFLEKLRDYQLLKDGHAL
jgi:hypothetical protein